jgi:hypothetical protein
MTPSPNPAANPTKVSAVSLIPSLFFVVAAAAAAEPLVVVTIVESEVSVDEPSMVMVRVSL